MFVIGSILVIIVILLLLKKHEQNKKEEVQEFKTKNMNKAERQKELKESRNSNRAERQKKLKEERKVNKALMKKQKKIKEEKQAQRKLEKKVEVKKENKSISRPEKPKVSSDEIIKNYLMEKSQQAERIRQEEIIQSRSKSNTNSAIFNLKPAIRLDVTPLENEKIKEAVAHKRAGNYNKANQNLHEPL